jgi:hypothetical protein
VSYFNTYSVGPTTFSNQTDDRLVGDMLLNYPDGTGESILFGITYAFGAGGLNISDHQVLNWSKVSSAGISMNTWGSVNGTQVATLYTFTGFDIVNGSANDFNLTRNDGPNNSYFYSINDIIGSLNYANSTAINIGAVTLSNASTTFEGKALNESIAKFNITLDAQISDFPLPPIPPQMANDTAKTVPVPVTMMFEITHDVAQTEVKYGLDVNWSAVKDFPTSFENPNDPNPLSNQTLATGDNFSLVAQDRLDFSSGTGFAPTAIFTTDAQNDSAIYVVNGTELCRELFPTSYTPLGSDQVYNTTRDYVPVSWQSTWNQSSMFVVIGGFRYNESSGFSFDPALITPNSVGQNSPITNPTTSITSSLDSTAGSTMSSSQNAQVSTSNQRGTSADPLAFAIPAFAIVAVLAIGSILVIKRRRAS